MAMATVSNDGTSRVGNSLTKDEESHERDPDPRADDGNNDNNAVPTKKSNALSARFQKLGLDKPTLLMMLKGSIPPIIAIAMCQAPNVAAYFTTLGYLIPIITIMALVVLPRGKFIMNMILCLVAVLFGSAISMLALWTGVQARLHTSSEPPTAQPLALVPYNSSQSAVCAVWLFANIWFGNVVRAKLPSFNIPVIIYSILVNIATTFGPLMATTATSWIFVRQLLVAMLVALGLASGVSLLIIPVSSRLVVFKEFTGAIGLLRKTISFQKAYLIRIESDDMFAVATRTDTSPQQHPPNHEKILLTKEAKAAKLLRETTEKMSELAGKLHADMTFAKRDIAWGKLDAKDLGELFTLVRDVYIPIMGMTTIIDIFKRVSEQRGWDVCDEDDMPEVVAEKEREKRVWNGVMRRMHEPFGILSEAIDRGLEHAGLCLELIPRPKLAAHSGEVDLEARGGESQPGDAGFARVIDERVQQFYSKRGELTKSWAREREFVEREELWEGSSKSPEERREREQAQLYVVLYMENLMHASGRAVQELVAFADKKVADGTMSRNRLIVPGFRRLRKWVLAILSNEDSSAEQAPDLMESNTNIIYFGDGYNKKKDPEHLPPTTPWQRFGTGLRALSDFFGSEESAFGFRAACATMTVGIIAFLESTQLFFNEQRLVWAMIIIAIGMTMTSGQSVFGFLCRVGGTVVAMCSSLVIWYIVAEKRPGAIVFLWFFVFIGYYFFIKFPRFIPAVMIGLVTQVLIIGYELQVLTIGEAIAQRSGQPFYPTYLLAPYRLACVAGGSLVAFFWTIFPKPLTDRTWLRRDMAAALYLMANYFGVINSTLQASLNDEVGDMKMTGTPAHQLYKAGRKIFGKLMLLLPSMAQHSDWQRWEPTIGGKFPREAYDEIILRSRRIIGYLSLISYTLTHPTPARPEEVAGNEKQQQQKGGSEEGESPAETSQATPVLDEEVWHEALAEVLDLLKPAHHAILSTLTLLSNSLLSGQSLPPFIPLPRPLEMTRRHRLVSLNPHLGRQDPAGESSNSSYPESFDSHSQHALRSSGGSGGLTINILDPQHMDQPGYAEFAVLQVCTTLVCDDLEGLVKAVSGLVGIVDFSFRVGSSESSIGSRKSTNGKKKGKAD